MISIKRSELQLYKRFSLAILSILLAGVYSSCSFKPSNIGAENELAILIDSELRGRIEAPLLDTFCPIVDTPQPERRFIPIFGGFDDLERLQTQRFLLLVGVLDDSGAVSQLITNMLSPEISEGIVRGDYYIFNKKNEWARGQQMLIIVTPDVQSLVDRLTSESESLFDIFNQLREELVFAKLFRKYEQKSLAKDIRERYGFDLRIPHDYALVREEPEAGWLRLKRSAPGRWITLYRSQPLEENPLDSAWVVDKWSELAAQFADPVLFNPDYLIFNEKIIAGYPGIEMRGLWETIGPQGGGPFFCQVFFCPVDHRVYYLEGEAYNPGDVKEPYVKQMEVILKTLRIPGDESNY